MQFARQIPVIPATGTVGRIISETSLDVSGLGEAGGDGIHLENGSRPNVGCCYSLSLDRPADNGADTGRKCHCQRTPEGDPHSCRQHVGAAGFRADGAKYREERE